MSYSEGRVGVQGFTNIIILYIENSTEVLEHVSFPPSEESAVDNHLLAPTLHLASSQRLIKARKPL